MEKEEGGVRAERWKTRERAGQIGVLTGRGGQLFTGGV